MQRGNNVSGYRETPPASTGNRSRIFEDDVHELNYGDDDDGRLPLPTALPLTILLALSCWVLVLTAGLWLARIAY